MALRSLLIIGGSLVALVVAEGLVRMFGLAPSVSNQTGWLVEDPYLPYRPRPGSTISGRSTTDEYDFHHVHNSRGFRDTEHEIEKPAGVFRILGLGDSFTVGWGAPYEETYLRRLEKKLLDRTGGNRPVEVIKCGINGYFAESEKLLLKHYGMAYSPDVVIVGFVPNDVLDTYQGLEAIRVSKQGYLTSRQVHDLGEVGIWFYVHSHLARIVLRRYLDATATELPEDWWMDLYRPSKTYAKSWRDLLAQYDDMLAMTRASGAEFVVLHIPNKNPGSDIHLYPAKRMAEWCENNRVLFVDALPDLRGKAKVKKLYWDRDSHCTPAGYRIISDVLFAALTKASLIR